MTQIKHPADTATAGFLNTDWNPRDVPADTVTRNVVLRTQDGAATGGSLYVRGRPDTVVCVMYRASSWPATI